MDYKWHKCKQGEMPEDIASPEMIIHRGLKEEYSGYIGNILCYNQNDKKDYNIGLVVDIMDVQLTLILRKWTYFLGVKTIILLLTGNL